MSIEKSLPIHLLEKNPGGWKRACLPKYKATAQNVLAQTPLTKRELQDLPWSQRHDYLNFYALKQQERRWEDEVGVKPEESHFTLIVPIYNEEKSLPSFLRTLMLLDIPPSVNLKVLFITNACSDSSNEIVDRFLVSLGKIECKRLDGEFKDRNLNKNYKEIKRNSIKFMHLDTCTRGKANALGIANDIARGSGHTIAISVDANNYLEPDSIRVMFTHAHNAFQGKPDTNDIVLLSGRIHNEMKASAYKNLLNKVRRMQQHLVDDSSDLVRGLFMAWDTEWMYSIGGPPQVAIEDYAMGVLARVKDYKVEQVKDANIWIYGVNDIKGLLNARARLVRGKLQILDLVNHDPAVLKIINKEAYYMKDLPGRLRHFLHKTKENPRNLPRYIATFILWEYAVNKGTREYKHDPTNQSWEKIDSTF